MSPLGQRVCAVLDDEFRSTAAVAERAGVVPQRAAPLLGHLRREGRVEWRQEGVTSLWRRRANQASTLSG